MRVNLKITVEKYTGKNLERIKHVTGNLRHVMHDDYIIVNSVYPYDLLRPEYYVIKLPTNKVIALPQLKFDKIIESILK